MTQLPETHPLITGRTFDSPLIRALTGRPPETVPVWFMRQAGRSLPEYRRARQGLGLLESCLMPALAAELTVQPVTRHGVDAAIFFSDIVVPLRLAGITVDIQPGVGPVFAHPVRTAADVEALPELTAEALAPIRQAVSLAVAALGDTPLIGFAGAPFTVAAYLVCGRPQRDQLAARELMHRDPGLWHALLERIAGYAAAFLGAQVEAGASAVQLFDSWVGSLTDEDYSRDVSWASARATAAIRALRLPAGRRIPVISYGLARTGQLRALAAAGDAVGLDYRVPIDVALRELGTDTPLQGNLDPALLAAPYPVLETAADRILAAGEAAPGHVFNLGHGVPPGTDPEVLTRLVAHIHAHPTAARAAVPGREGPATA
jgi:uroporphyrinogen decarboxylase